MILDLSQERVKIKLEELFHNQRWVGNFLFLVNNLCADFPLNNDVKSLVVIAMRIRAKCPLLPIRVPNALQEESDSLNGMEECCRGREKGERGRKCFFSLTFELWIVRKGEILSGFYQLLSGALLQALSLFSEPPGYCNFLGGIWNSEEIQDLGSRYCGYCILIRGLNSWVQTI